MTDTRALPHLSVLLPTLARHPQEFLPFMSLVRQTTARRLWTGQPLLMDACQGFAYGAGQGLRVPVGTAVALAPTRHPFEAALQARGLAMTTGHTVEMGFGPGDPAFQRGLLGRPWRSPLTAMREFIVVCRELLAGGPVKVRGEYYTLVGRQGATRHPRVRLGLGVLRPAMARLAGEVADTAITWLTPPAYIAGTLRPAMLAGAERAGRPAPRVVAAVHVALDRDGRDPLDLLYRTSAGHLRAAHYLDMLHRAGVPTDRDDWRITAKGLIEAGVFLHGDPGTLAAGLRDYAAAGVDEVILNLHGAATTQGLQETLDELGTVLELGAGR
ncbi:LLM class flavin-dependent oxidoreductase [Streptomyces sp. PRKS01-65]|nr:LLM class flavin-dependent oxidoreductase [Streptomyces harenosi]NEY33701.1 LLM class flavin-dependent oxidoreductase [Streptomyces harenosi]